MVHGFILEARDGAVTLEFVLCTFVVVVFLFSIDVVVVVVVVVIIIIVVVFLFWGSFLVVFFFSLLSAKAWSVALVRWGSNVTKTKSNNRFSCHQMQKNKIFVFSLAQNSNIFINIKAG